MEKAFEELLKTSEGREVIFNVLTVAFAYKAKSQNPTNPLMKALGPESMDVQRMRKLLFQSLDEFEAFIRDLYTPNKETEIQLDGLTSGS